MKKLSIAFILVLVTVTAIIPLFNSLTGGRAIVSSETESSRRFEPEEPVMIPLNSPVLIVEAMALLGEIKRPLPLVQVANKTKLLLNNLYLAQAPPALS